LAKTRGSLEDRVTESLRLIAPGTTLREALDNIVRARTGALLVFAEEPAVEPLISGGISIDVETAPMILYELAKMDGAILLNRNGTRISHANVHLMPDPTISSTETGTRHRTAERVAKQIDALVLSISAARDVVSLYVDHRRYVLEEIRVILTKANQALQTLEKYRSRLTQVSTTLSALEFEGAVTLHDVLTVLQRAEMVLMIADEIEHYIIELGSEGRLIRLQLEELMVDVREDRRAVIADYMPDDTGVSGEEIADILRTLKPDDLLVLGLIGESLGYSREGNPAETQVSPRGYRMLRKIPRLPHLVISNLVARFGRLESILGASKKELDAVEGVGPIRAHDIKEGFLRLRELNLLERYG
jgi:diadenylate cyclase